MMSLARSCSTLDLATLLCSTIWSNRLSPSSNVAVCAAGLSCADMSASLGGFEAGQLAGVIQYLAQNIFQLFVTGQFVTQVRQLGARLQQLGQWFDLAHHSFRTEVVHPLKRSST